MDPATVLRFSEKATFRAVADSAIILMTDSGQLYSCNETGQAFLSRVDGLRTIGEIAALVCEDYDVPPGTLVEDMEPLLAMLQDEGVLVKLVDG